MSLSKVVIAADVYYVLESHAHTTEREEVMSLLLGDVVTTEEGAVVSRVWGVSVQAREVKEADRVEVSPEMLAESARDAEEMSAATGRPTRVVGWHHSHPHISPFPSHVDLRTQASYQLLDPNFVGIITAVFEVPRPDTPPKASSLAFQSVPADGSHLQALIPLTIAPSSGALSPGALSKLVALQLNLLKEEMASYASALNDILLSANAGSQDPGEGGQNTDQSSSLLTAQAAGKAPTATLHAASVYQKTLARTLELVTLPLATALTDKVVAAKLERDALIARKAELESS